MNEHSRPAAGVPLSLLGSQGLLSPRPATSVFEDMSELSRHHGALDLTIGTVEFGVTDELLELICKHVSGGMNQYAPMVGCPELRYAIARSAKQSLGVSYDPHDEVTVTVGATGATFAALASVLDAGDKVIVLEPAFDAYAPTVERCGGQVVPVQINLAERSIPWDLVEDAARAHARAIIINTPHNPSGLVFSHYDMEQLSNIVDRYNLFVVSDEVYERTVFDGRQHISITQYPQLAERGFAIFSLSKTFHATGWKVGYCLAPKRLSAGLREVHRVTAFAVHTPTQLALAEHLDSSPDYDSNLELCERKRNLFVSGLANSRFSAARAQGSLFQLVSYTGTSVEESDVDFALRLARDHGVAAVPVSPLCTRSRPGNYLRFCFAREDKTLIEATNRLRRV